MSDEPIVDIRYEVDLPAGALRLSREALRLSREELLALREHLDGLLEPADQQGTYRCREAAEGWVVDRRDDDGWTMVAYVPGKHVGPTVKELTAELNRLDEDMVDMRARIVEARRRVGSIADQVGSCADRLRGETSSFRWAWATLDDVVRHLREAVR